MQLVWATDRFVFQCTYHDRHVPKEAGFNWNPKQKQWWTADPIKAHKLIEYAEPETRKMILTKLQQYEDTLSASRALNADIKIPAPEGLEYLPFQKAGIAYALDRPNVLIADEMGLGKTIQAIGIINMDDSIKTALIIVPATLRINWKRELEKWLIRPMTVGIAVSKTWPDTDIVIVNYDILKNHRENIRRHEWDCLICDESHYLKNPKAQRTKEVVGARGLSPILARRKIFLTGTPILNRPVELWTTLKFLDANTWRSWRYFTDRYCDAHHNGWGWDVSGASNLDELQEKLRSTIMVRRLKKEVLKELPPKRRQVIALPNNGFTKTIEAEWRAFKKREEMIRDLKIAVELAKASDDPQEYREAVEELKKGLRVAFEEMSRARYEVAMAKLPMVIEHIKDVLDSEEKVVVFGHHLDVLNTIYETFQNEAVILTGETKHEDRQLAVDRFQNDPSVRLFIGSIKAAGVGITLTAASTAVFAELDWVPANVSQAEDRLHRIGQANSVLVQHLVLDGSLDAAISQALVDKQQVIDEALDAAIEFSLPPPLPYFTPATENITRREIEHEAETITEDEITAVHEGLIILAGLDADYASTKNFQGFNVFDTKIGHSLACQPKLTPKQAVLGRKILAKYHRQLGDGLLKRMGLS